MKFFKKWGILIVFLVMLAIIATILFIGYKAVTTYKQTIADQQASIDDMSNFIDNEVGELVNCFVLTKDVRVGDLIESDMLEQVTVPERLAYSNQDVLVEVPQDDGTVLYETQKQRALTVVTNANEILGKKFRVDLNEGALVMLDFVVNEVLENDQREYQLLLDQYPTDIKEGDYIDIRILLTFGQDFIALPHKRIEKLDLYNGLFTFVFNEDEINTYNSMLLDKDMYSNVNIYALKYLDTAQQVAAEAYYPVNTNIQEMLTINPNILNTVKKEMQLKREELNAIMGGYIDEFDDRELNQTISSLAQYRQQYTQGLNGAIRSRIQAEEEAARRAAQGY